MAQGFAEPPVQGRYVATPPTLADGDTHTMRLTDDGLLLVATGNEGPFTSIGAEWDDTLTVVPNTDGTYAACRISQGRALHVQLRRTNGTNTTELLGQQAAADSIPVTLDAVQNGYLSALNATVKAEDSPISGTFYGILGMTQRQDTPTTDTSTSDDAQPVKSDSVGRLHVTLGTQTVQVQSNSANLATETTLAAVKTAAELIDDTVYLSSGANTNRVIGLGAEVDEGVPTTVLEGQIGSLRMSSARILRVALTSAAGADVTTDLATQTTLAAVLADTTAIKSHLDNVVETDDIGTITHGAVIAGKLTGAADAVDTLVNNSRPAVPHLSKNRSLHVELRKGAVQFGTATDPIRTDPTGTTTQPISVTSLPLPTGAATEATQLLVKTAVELIDNTVDNGSPFGPVLNVSLKSFGATAPAMAAGVAASGLRVAPPTDATFLVSDSVAQTTLTEIKNAVELIDDVVHASSMSVGATAGKLVAIGAKYENDSIGDLGITDDDKIFPVRQGKQRQMWTSVYGGDNTPKMLRATDGGTVYTAIRNPADDTNIGITSSSLHVHVNNSPAVTQGSAPWTMRLQDGDSGVLADVLDLTNSNPVTVAIVDASGTQITSFGGGTQFAEDAAHVTGAIGTLSLAVRNDTHATTLTDINGDYSAISVSDTGEVYVNDTTLATAVQAMLASHSASFTNAGVVGHGVYRATPVTTGIADGEAVGLAATQHQSLHVNLRSGNAEIAGAVGTPLYAAISDGTTKATVRELGANDALNVAIVDGSGAQITTFGGGTQYTEADVDTTITGTAFMWEDTSDTLRAVSTAKPLPVQVGNTVTVDSELPAAAALADATVNPTVPGVGAYLMGFDGTDWDRVRLSGSNGSLQTNVTNTSLTVVQSTATNLLGQMQITDGTDIATVESLTSSGFAVSGQKGLNTNAYLRGINTAGTDALPIKASASLSLHVNIAEQSLASLTVTDAKLESGFYEQNATFGGGAGERFALIGGEYDDASTSLPVVTTDEDKVWPCRITQKRALMVALTDNDGNIVGRPGAGKLGSVGNPVGIQVDQIGGGHMPKAVSALAYAVTPGSVGIDDDSNWAAANYDGALYHVDPVTIMSARTFQATTEAGDNTVLSCRGNYVELGIKIKKTGSPDRIQFIVYWTDDEAGTTPLWYKTDHGFEQAIFFVATELASAGTDYGYQMVIPRRGQYMKITGLPNVGTGSNYYTVTIDAKSRVGML